MKKTVVLSLVLFLLLAIHSGSAADPAPSWTAHLEYDPDLRVGVDQSQGYPISAFQDYPISPVGVRVTGVDLGGCPEVKEMMIDSVEHEMMEGIIGPGFVTQTAEVHCFAQLDDTKFLLVLLGSGYSPAKHLSGHGYVVADSSIDSQAAPVMGFRESPWGGHAIRFLIENGKVVRVAFVYQDRLGDPYLHLWGLDGQPKRNIRRFYLASDESRVYAISVSEIPCFDRDKCPRRSRQLVVMEHSASDKILDSRVLKQGTQEQERKALEEPLMKEFEKLTQGADPVGLKWIYP